MWKLIIGFVLAVLAPLVLEHFMSRLSENMWRILALLCVLAGIGTICDSSYVRPFWSDYRHHRFLSTASVMVVAALMFGTVWCLFVLKIPSQNLDLNEADDLIPKWLKESKRQYKKLTAADTVFWYVAYNYEGQPINILVHNSYKDYVITETRVPIDDTTKERITKLSEKGRLSFFHELHAEILKQQLNCKFDIPLSEVTVANQISLKELNKESLLTALATTTDQSLLVLLQITICLDQAETIKGGLREAHIFAQLRIDAVDKNHFMFDIQLRNGGVTVNNIRLFSGSERYLHKDYRSNAGMMAPNGTLLISLSQYPVKTWPQDHLDVSVYYHANVDGETKHLVAKFRFRLSAGRLTAGIIDPESSNYDEGMPPAPDEVDRVLKERLDAAESSVVLRFDETMPIWEMRNAVNSRGFVINAKERFVFFRTTTESGRLVDLRAELTPNNSKEHAVMFAWSAKGGSLTVDGKMIQDYGE